jgi:hypothetical protein
MKGGRYMSTAKTSVLEMLNTVPDDIQEEMVILECLYKMMKLETSRKSVKSLGVMSTDEVRAHFIMKHERNAVPV